MSDNSSSSTAIVAIIAILVIIAVGFIIFRMVPGMGNTTDGGDIDVQLEDGIIPGNDDGSVIE